jgi:subtilisin-like proprotein convertase family protein
MEECDDANMVNTDACLNTCKNAKCGDGVIQAGVEQCEGANLNGQTCMTQGFSGGTLACTGQCAFDKAQCSNVANPYTACVSPNTAIPSSGLGTASNIMVPVGGLVKDVDVKIVGAHTWIGDLTWTLTKGATSKVLINRVTNGSGGCSSDNLDVTLDDESVGGAVQAQCNAAPPAISGNRTPNVPLNAFDGVAMDGAWTLQPNDLAAGDGGTFQQWCVTITW